MCPEPYQRKVGSEKIIIVVEAGKINCDDKGGCFIFCEHK